MAAVKSLNVCSRVLFTDQNRYLNMSSDREYRLQFAFRLAVSA